MRIRPKLPSRENPTVLLASNAPSLLTGPRILPDRSTLLGAPVQKSFPKSPAPAGKRGSASTSRLVFFAHLTGDNAEHGIEEEYLLVQRAIDQLQMPLFVTAVTTTYTPEVWI
jgi:hypothetical protein